MKDFLVGPNIGDETFWLFFVATVVFIPLIVFIVNWLYLYLTKKKLLVAVKSANDVIELIERRRDAENSLIKKNRNSLAVSIVVAFILFAIAVGWICFQEKTAPSTPAGLLLVAPSLIAICISYLINKNKFVQVKKAYEDIKIIAGRAK